MTTIILYVYVSHYFSCSYALLTDTHTHTHTHTLLLLLHLFFLLIFLGLFPISGLCNLFLLLVLSLWLHTFVSLLTIQVTYAHTKQRSSLAPTFIRRQKSQSNSNYFHVFEVKRNINNLIFFLFCIGKQILNEYLLWTHKTDIEPSERNLEIYEKMKVQKITCLEIINGRTKIDPGLLTTHAPLIVPCSFLALSLIPALNLGGK